MRFMVEYGIDFEVMKHAKIDVEKMEHQIASQKLAAKIFEHFPAKKVDMRNVHPFSRFQEYHVEVHVYGDGLLREVFKKLNFLKSKTNSPMAKQHLNEIRDLLIQR